MKHLAAYLLLGLGGNASPSADDVKAVLESVGIEADQERLDKLISELEGKDINEVYIGKAGLAIDHKTNALFSSSLRVARSLLLFLLVVLVVPLLLVVLPLLVVLLPLRRLLLRRRLRRRRSLTTTWASVSSTKRIESYIGGLTTRIMTSIRLDRRRMSGNFTHGWIGYSRLI